MLCIYLHDTTVLATITCNHTIHCIILDEGIRDDTIYIPYPHGRERDAHALHIVCMLAYHTTLSVVITYIMRIMYIMCIM